MKIRITNEAKTWLTVAEMPIAKRIISDLKEYAENNFTDEIQRAAAIAARRWGEFEILKSQAEIAGNRRANGYHGENAGRLDVWIEAYVYALGIGFYNIGFYVSDIWGADGENGEEIRSHMYIEEYTKTGRN